VSYGRLDRDQFGQLRIVTANFANPKEAKAAAKKIADKHLEGVSWEGNEATFIDPEGPDGSLIIF
jgi:hypothetical protein